MRRGIVVIIVLGLVSTLVLLIGLGSLTRELARRGGVVSPEEKALRGHLMERFGDRLLTLGTVRIHAEPRRVRVGGRAQAHRDLELPGELAAAAWRFVAARHFVPLGVEVELQGPDGTVRRGSLRKPPKKPKPPRPKRPMEKGKDEGTTVR